MSTSVNGNGAQIKMYTTDWCPDCWRAKSVMRGQDVEFEEINVEGDEDARELVQRLNNGNISVPTIVFPDGDVLTEPSTTVLMAKLSQL
ncbi:MAG: NrdH-redoxin [Caldilineaceae bacterium SB0670_bin_27]|uniref:NrdH-redoxin n=1 Tax=Caldilineaceae bacterium SB0664_bin_27 TaxID=2605260 RepID=A0A6B0YVR2_9CHLR|nr:NrdH-redoxin [Caldilineaceae bacterium SB0664_bin_27]MYJ77225.1 NrdH-redoxin [Caldilineaceae bacterium SB0670_bin_27]